MKYVRNCWSNRYTTVSESAICRFLSVTIFRSACKSQHKVLIDHSLQILPGSSSRSHHCSSLYYMHVHVFILFVCIATYCMTLYGGFVVMQWMIPLQKNYKYLCTTILVDCCLCLEGYTNSFYRLLATFSWIFICKLKLLSRVMASLTHSESYCSLFTYKLAMH